MSYSSVASLRLSSRSPAASVASRRLSSSGWLLLVVLFCLFGPPAAAAEQQPSTSDESQARKTQESETGPERCLTAVSPFWCLAEETAAGLGNLGIGRAASSSLDSSQGVLGTAGDIVSSALDLVTSGGGSLEDESRSRRRRKLGFILMVIGTILAVVIPLKLKAIAIVAITALFVGKLALVLASLVGLKKIVNKQSEDTTHVHYTGHRSDADSHYLAYSEHAPPGVETVPYYGQSEATY